MERFNKGNLDLITVLKDYLGLSLLGVVIGAIVGLMVSFFGDAVVFLATVREDNLFYLLPFLPLVGTFIIYYYERFGKNSDRGLSLILETIDNDTHVSYLFIPLLMSTALLTHLFGGSAGRTGAAIQIGAGVAYLFYPVLKKTPNNSYQILIFSGMAAGFASLFQLPIVAVCFVWEMVRWQNLKLRDYFTAFVSSCVASMVPYYLGYSPFTYLLNYELDINWKLIVQLVILGLVFGFVGNGFAILLNGLRRYLPKCLPNPYWRIAILSTLLAMILLYYKGRYSGLGTELIPLIEAENSQPFDWLFKLVLTAITVSIGFQGGEVTPLFAIGSSLGFVLAPLTNLPSDVVIALGYLGVFVAATNTFFAPLLLSISIFGIAQLPLFLVCLATSYLLTQHFSIYPNEREVGLKNILLKFAKTGR